MFSGSKECDDAGQQLADCVLKPQNGEGCCVFKNRAYKPEKLTPEPESKTREHCEDSSCSKASRWEGCKDKCKGMDYCEQFQWNSETKECRYFNTMYMSLPDMFSGSKECNVNEVSFDEESGADYILSSFFLIVSSLLVNIVMI